MAALAEDRVLSRTEKEVVIKTAACSVFRYSAGFVNWTRTKLESTSKCGSVHISKHGRSLVALTALQLYYPSAVDMRTREVYDAIEQCVGVPTEI